MATNKIVITLLLLLGCTAFITQAQTAQTQSTGGHTSNKATLLKIRAMDPDRDVKMTLLGEIEQGEIAMDSDTVDILAILAGDGTVYRNGPAGNAFNNSDIRMRAIYALGKVGGDSARTYILNSLNAETDSTVKSVAFLALGDLGVDSEGRTLAIMNNTMRRELAKTRQNSVATDYLTAIQKLVNGSTADFETMEIVNELADTRGGFNMAVRTQASTLLKSFWSGK